MEDYNTANWLGGFLATYDEHAVSFDLRHSSRPDGAGLLAGILDAAITIMALEVL